VAAALIELSGCRAFADCDVDAPNLRLVMLRLTESGISDYYGLGKASIDPEKCIRCGLCEKHCAFGAIRDCKINEFKCEGCGVCAELCQTGAVSMLDAVSGQTELYRDNEKVLSTARLKVGGGTSGKLVTAVKRQLAQNAPEADLAVIDGSPGIGCPVIASISGVNFVLLVAEPTVSGQHDLKRILETVRHFGVSCAVCINKYDVAPGVTEEIERFCGGLSVPVVGRIPFDDTVVKAVNQCQSIAAYPDSPAGRAVTEIWSRISKRLFGDNIHETNKNDRK
jgi:MinD superfamily P-loop ATPase